MLASGIVNVRLMAFESPPLPPPPPMDCASTPCEPWPLVRTRLLPESVTSTSLPSPPLPPEAPTATAEPIANTVSSSSGTGRATLRATALPPVPPPPPIDWASIP